MKINLSHLKLLTFDVTGTLLQFRHSPGKQYSEIGALYGVFCDKDKLSKNFKQSWKKMTTEHPNFGLNSMGWEKWWKIVVFETFKDADTDKYKLEDVSNHLIECYKSMECWEQSYGALGLISFLRNRNMPLGIVSNFDDRLGTILQNAHLRHYFNFVLTSYQAGFEKPDPRIFEKALKFSGIDGLRPEDCLHIGDRVGLDYKGAKAAGWNALIVNEKKFEDIQEDFPDITEDEVVNNLHDLHTSLSDENIATTG